MPLWLSILLFILCIICAILVLRKWKQNKKVIYLIASIWLIITSVATLGYGLLSMILIGGID